MNSGRSLANMARTASALSRDARPWSASAISSSRCAARSGGWSTLHEEPLRLPGRERGDRREHQAVLEEPRLEHVVAGDHLAHQAERERLVGGHHPLLQEEPQRPLVPERARERPGETAVGRGGDAGVAGVEARRRRGDADVGVHREREPEAHGDAVHAGEHRLLALDPHDRREVAERSLVVGLGGRRLGPVAGLGGIVLLGEVEPGAERVAVPGDRDRPHVVVVRRFAQRGHQRPDELAGQRVLALGPVEPEDPQPFLGDDLEHRVRPDRARAS